MVFGFPIMRVEQTSPSEHNSRLGIIESDGRSLLLEDVDSDGQVDIVYLPGYFPKSHIRPVYFNPEKESYLRGLGYRLTGGKPMVTEMIEVMTRVRNRWIDTPLAEEVQYEDHERKMINLVKLTAKFI